jgi:hypothetical protein
MNSAYVIRDGARIAHPKILPRWGENRAAAEVQAEQAAVGIQRKGLADLTSVARPEHRTRVSLLPPIRLRCGRTCDQQVAQLFY